MARNSIHLNDYTCQNSGNTWSTDTLFVYSVHHWPYLNVTNCTKNGSNSTESIYMTIQKLVFDNFMISSKQYTKRLPASRTNYHSTGQWNDLYKTNVISKYLSIHKAASFVKTSLMIISQFNPKRHYYHHYSYYY